MLFRSTHFDVNVKDESAANMLLGSNDIALAFELQGKKASKEDLAKILAEVDLSGLEKRKPNELSGLFAQ